MHTTRLLCCVLQTTTELQASGVRLTVPTLAAELERVHTASLLRSIQHVECVVHLPCLTSLADKSFLLASPGVGRSDD